MGELYHNSVKNAIRPTRENLGTTNLSGEELEARYTMRVCSRLKDLMVPLHLKGGDKRRWRSLPAKEGDAR